MYHLACEPHHCVRNLIQRQNFINYTCFYCGLRHPVDYAGLLTLRYDVSTFALQSYCTVRPVPAHSRQNNAQNVSAVLVSDAQKHDVSGRLHRQNRRSVRESAHCCSASALNDEMFSARSNHYTAGFEGQPVKTFNYFEF